MKKFSFVLALVLVLAFASSAFAAQVISGTPGQDLADDVKYLPTAKTFNPDGKTNYPYEIYLPNEGNPAQYRIHSNYSKNTDACAACHATHTAVGASLLQWYTVYDTCMACHDGTVSTTYNVEDGKIGTGKPTFGGMFGVGTEGSLSNHNVRGGLAIAAAPGGSTVGTETVAGAHGATETRWVREFGCESCHTPHGQGGNARILHPDANYAASWAAKNRATAYEYPVSSVNGYVYDKDPAAADAKKVYILKGYPYSPEVWVDGAKSTAYKVYNVEGVSKVVYASDNTDPDFSGKTVVIKNGVAALTVKMNIANYLDGVNETVQHVSGMNSFCGACHTDYNTENWDGKGATSGSAEEETGTYSKAHRHQVGFFAGYFQVANANMVFESGKMECLTCHVAHGTNADYWTRTIGSQGTGYLADGDLVELAGSSALKRVPNMGTCEACHGKGAGNEGYNTNTGLNVDGATPGTTYNIATLATSFSASAQFVGGCDNCHAGYAEKFAESFHGEAGRAFDSFSDVRLAGNKTWATGEYVYIKAATNQYWKVSKDDITNVMMGGTYAGVIFDEAVDNTGASIANPAVSTAVYRALALAEEEDTTTGATYYLLEDKSHVQFAYDATLDGYLSNNTPSVWGTIQNSIKPNIAGDCFTCHADGLRTAGWKGSKSGVTCESCHGTGANHVKAPMPQNIINPAKVSAADQVAVCGRCHTGDNYYTGSPVASKFDNHRGTLNYLASGHYSAGITCVTCHSMHSGHGSTNILNGEANWGDLKTTSYDQLCATCHDSSWLTTNGYTDLSKDRIMPTYYDVTKTLGVANVVASDGSNKYGNPSTITKDGHNISRDHGFGWLQNQSVSHAVYYDGKFPK